VLVRKAVQDFPRTSFVSRDGTHNPDGALVNQGKCLAGYIRSKPRQVEGVLFGHDTYRGVDHPLMPLEFVRNTAGGGVVVIVAVSEGKVCRSVREDTAARRRGSVAHSAFAA